MQYLAGLTWGKISGNKLRVPAKGTHNLGSLEGQPPGEPELSGVRFVSV